MTRKAEPWPVSISGKCAHYRTGLRLREGDVGVGRVVSEEDGAEYVLKLASTQKGIVEVARELLVLESLATPGHPTLVKVEDSGRVSGRPWFVTRFFERRLEGLDRAPHDPEEVLSRLGALRDVAAALRYLHERGWVHADVNPENIRMHRERGMLIDLGAARSVQEVLEDPLGLATESGAGTLGYIAPERVWGDIWDCRADVYSLGCVFYQWMAGHPVFRASSATGLKKQHLERDAPRAPGVLKRFDPKLASILERMLAKEPWNRLLDLGELVCAVDERFFNSAPRPNRSLLGESRPFGRGRELNEIDKFLRASNSGAPPCALLLGSPGVGLTRLLCEAARRAKKQGWDVISASETDRPSHGPRVLLVVDAECSRAAWSRTLRLCQKKGYALLGAQHDTPEAQALAAEVSAVQGYVFRVEPMGRPACRRMAADLFGGHASGDLVDDLARDSAGRPKELLREAQRRNARGDLVLDSHWTWHARSTMAREPSGGIVEACRERKLAWESRIRDPSRSLRHLERAYQCYRGSSSALGRRAGLKLGFFLLRDRARAGDHASVIGVGSSLLEIGAGENPLLEARILRHVALAHRVTGRHDRAQMLLTEGMGRLEAAVSSRRALVERERIRNRLDASWTHYADHDASAALEAARSAAAAARKHGTAQQRAAVHLHLANAMALSGRFAFTMSAVRHERCALRIHRLSGSELSERAAARFELGFMLLLGDEERCLQAVEVLETAAQEADASGSGVVAARVAAYLAIAYRRTRQTVSCKRMASLALERARDCEQNGYLGVAHACLGWVSLHEGRDAQAVEELRRAVTIWQRNRSSDVERRAEFPFQWLALVPWLTMETPQATQHQWIRWCEDLCHPTQAVLPAALREHVTSAARQGRYWQLDRWEKWKTDLARAAAGLRYL